MEFLRLFSSFTNTTCFLLISIFFFSIVKLNTITRKSKKLPPGPWKLPIIGSMHHLVKMYPTHETLSKLAKKYGPVMHLQLGEISVVVVSSPEVAKLVMKRYDLAFADRPGTLATDLVAYNKSNIAFALYSDYWRQMKKLCILELLSTKRVKSYQPIRELEVAKMIASIRKSAGSPINMSALLFTLSSSILSGAVLGDNIHDQGVPFNLGIVEEIVSLLGSLNLVDVFPSLKVLASVTRMNSKLKTVHKKVDMMLQGIIEKRREYYSATESNGRGDKKMEDIIDTLLRLQKENEQEVPITDNHIKAIALDLFIGGAESSATIVEWAMSELIRNPDKMEKVQTEVRQSIDGHKNTEENEAHGLRYLSFVLKETLRLHPPGPILVPRECREACEINGYNIPIKTKVIVNAWAIGRDPDVWKDADKFIPERFENYVLEFNGTNFECLPFGSGRRMCPGIGFGLATVKLALIQLLYHFNWKLPDNAKGESIDMAETSGLAAKRKVALQLVCTVRG